MCNGIRPVGGSELDLSRYVPPWEIEIAFIAPGDTNEKKLTTADLFLLLGENKLDEFFLILLGYIQEVSSMRKTICCLLTMRPYYFTASNQGRLIFEKWQPKPNLRVFF